MRLVADFDFTYIPHQKKDTILYVTKCGGLRNNLTVKSGVKITFLGVEINRCKIVPSSG